MKKLIVIIIGLFIINGVNANNFEFKIYQKSIKKEKITLASTWTPSMGTCPDGSQFISSSTTTTVSLDVPCFDPSLITCISSSTTTTPYNYSNGGPCAY